MINIVIPMAGRGSRFADNGYELPKPLIPVHGIPMIELVIKNLTPSVPHVFTFICREEHLRDYNLEKYIENGMKKSIFLCLGMIQSNLYVASADMHFELSLHCPHGIQTAQVSQSGKNSILRPSRKR